MFASSCRFTIFRIQIEWKIIFQASIIDSDLEELAQLKSMLLQLTNQIDANPTSSDQAEFIDLRTQLAELVALKEEQVIESKKSSLSRLVQKQPQPPDGGNAVAFIQNLHDQPGVTTATKTVDGLVGRRCSIPGWTSRGKFFYQNAVVCGVVNDDTTAVTEHTARVHILLAHPTQTNDVPCPHFVDNGFCFRGLRCPYSHGKVVCVKVIMICNRSKLQFVSGGVLSPQDSLCAVSEGVSSNTVTACEDDKMAASTFPLGAWEAHTRGIGSRLLLKMGYDGQSGLGRSGEGRILPVSLSLKDFQIVSRKWGRRPTLDRILFSQNDKTTNTIHKQVIGNKVVNCPKGETKETVFSFLNNVMQSPGDSEEAINETENKSLRLDVSSLSSATNVETHLRIQNFHLQKEIGDVLRQIDQAQKSADRNKGRDQLIVKQAKRRLDVLQVKFAKLHESKRACSALIRKQISEKNLRFF
ncbi:uncharacterized protein DEA37_0006372 [Paragonimus westermani]|uniref:Zinc finger CCCH-type with G patch domain-containing protein n=1 Tax=Paragonimus westermani TaxID=34504 RepID=A0A5J4N7B2_9TREM|nr:uncharacterized protein DEA37_0006372 [Paragonimus westermani]